MITLKNGDHSVATLLISSFYTMENSDGKYYLYDVETGQPTSDEMETPEEVKEWYDQTTGGVWYAVLEDDGDDWSRGSFDYNEAIEIANNYNCDIICDIVGELCEKTRHRGEDF